MYGVMAFQGAIGSRMASGKISSSVRVAPRHDMGLFGKRRWSSNHCEVSLVGKTALVTGANTGIGKATAHDFYRRGARVIIACRDTKKGEEAVAEMKSSSPESQGELVVRHVDLSDLTSVRACAAAILQCEPQLNLLVNNAGIMGHPEPLTKDGHDMHFGVNHLGHFLLTMLLLPLILQSAPARIVTVSSLAHCFPLVGGRLELDDLRLERRWLRHQLLKYSQSKVANVLFSRELSERLRGHHVTTYSLHPGVIATQLGRNFDQMLPGVGWLWSVLSARLLKTPEQGAQTTLYCALEPSLAEQSGYYYSACRPATPTALVHCEALRRRLWTDSLRYVGLPDDFDPFHTAHSTNL